MYIYVFPPKREKKKKENLPESCEHRDFGKDAAIASEAEAHAAHVARRQETDFLTRILTPMRHIHFDAHAAHAAHTFLLFSFS
jgi:hypothetical protein